MKLSRRVGPGAVTFLAVWLLLLAAGRSAFLRDPGTFWHTTTGELILKDGFIRADPYTFTFGGTWWVPYQWLGEVAMALAHRAAGFDAQLLGAVTVIAAVFAWLAVRLQRTGLTPVVVACLLGLTLAASSSHFHVRPHLFTLACLTLTAVWLADCDAGRCSLSRLAWLVPLYALWTNVHGGVLAGLGTLGLVFAGWCVFWRLGLSSPVKSWREVLLLAVIGVGCGLTTLANPYGTDLLRTWHVIMGEPALKEIIQEHRPLDLAESYAWPVLALAAVYLLVLAGVLVRRGEGATKRQGENAEGGSVAPSPLRPFSLSRLRASWLLPLAWLVQAFDRCRHAPLFAVTCAVMIAAMWEHTRWAAWTARHRPDVYSPPTDEPRTPLWANLWVPAVAVVVAFALQVARVPVPLVGAGWARHDPAHWPVELLDVLKEHEPHSAVGNHLFNEYIDGGFVIYHAPGYKVFVDDRCEVFGGAWLTEFVAAGHGGTAAAVAGWERTYGNFDFALTRTGSGFDSYFRTSGYWLLVKETPTASFYKRH
jgi:hypothetical protein